MRRLLNYMAKRERIGASALAYADAELTNFYFHRSGNTAPERELPPVFDAPVDDSISDSENAPSDDPSDIDPTMVDEAGDDDASDTETDWESVEGEPAVEPNEEPLPVQ
ncbi:MAG: hypothetical protein R3A47_02050 [Polyangiales bacterium]